MATTSSLKPAAPTQRLTWVAYVAPMVLFMVLTYADSALPRVLYPAVYAVKVVVVTAALIAGRRFWRPDVRFDARVLPLAMLVGLAVFAEWVILDRWVPYPHLGSRTALNPFAAIPSPAARALFLLARFYGLALLVPVMEELFWRDILLRWFTQPDYETVPVGRFSWPAFWLVAAGFAAAHPEWLAALICAVAFGLLLQRTRSLFACIVAHAVANLALGLYVLTTGAWRLW